MFRSKAPSARSFPSRPRDNNGNENYPSLENQVEPVPIPNVESALGKRVAINSITTSSSGKKILRLPVLYTKHVTKKRKSYSEGFLKLVSLNGMIRGSLIDSGDVREVPLESRYLQAAECQLFKSRTPHTLKFEHHLIEVSFDTEPDDNVPATTSEPVTGLVPKRFVPPKPFVPPKAIEKELGARESLDRNSVSFSSSTRIMSSSSLSNGRYAVPEDELDAIWGESPSMKDSRKFSSLSKEMQPQKYRRTDDMSKSRIAKSSSNAKQKEVTFSTGKEIRNKEEVSYLEEEEITNKSKYQVKQFMPPLQPKQNEEEEEEEVTENQQIAFLDPFNLGQDIWND